MNVTIINAGGNNDYLYGLLMGMSKITNMSVDVIDTDKSVPIFSKWNNIKLLPYINNYGHDIPYVQKVKRLICYHSYLLIYAWQTDNRIIHIQWENKFWLIDRILLPAYYRVLGKKLVFTVHNVDAMKRNGRSSWYNRLTLRYMYSRMDRLIAHTESIKRELIEQFNIPETRIEVIMHGINVKGTMANTLKADDRKKLHIPNGAKVLLLFGALTRYKGFDMMLEAMPNIISVFPETILLIAGNATKKEQYLKELVGLIERLGINNNVIIHSKWIGDDEVETYFNAADCLVLPYRNISQSGVPFMAYRFGLPVIATRVGGLPEVVIEGKTGYLCDPNPNSLSDATLRYFEQDLFKYLETSRSAIKEITQELFSWDKIAEKTCKVYRKLIQSPKESV